MTEQQWRIVTEVMQEAQTASDQALMERLTAAVGELNLPASVVERMQQAAAAAVRRAFQHDATRVACVTILTQAMDEKEASMPRSWGFFLINRGSVDGAEHHIELFVYPDGS